MDGLLGCIFLLHLKACVTVLVHIQIQTSKHTTREEKENN